MDARADASHHVPDEPELRGDCPRCAALCCIALAFDRGEHFAYDKDAGAPCRHLTPQHRCTIHDSLGAQGFSGCLRYDCLGAGQRVTQELFAGRSWRDDPALAAPMFDAFRRMRRVHELLELLRAAGRLKLTPLQRQTRDRLQRALSPQQGWSRDALAQFERGPLAGEVQDFLASLRDLVTAG